MALNKEDKADIKGAMGKAIANKVSKVTHDKARIEHKYHQLRSGKSRQQQHDEAMSGNYKSNPLKGVKVTSKINKPFKMEALHAKQKDADRNRDD